MKSHRFFAILITLCLLIGAFPAVSAVVDQEGAEQAIIDSCTYGIEVDMSQYHLTIYRLETMFYDLLDTGKLPWYTKNTYQYHYDESSKIVSRFTPALLEEDIYNRKAYEARVAEILDRYIFDGMDQVQIALALHDALIVNCFYDDALEKRTGYDLLVGGTTVCSGYAAAYQDLLNRMGIPCITVHSESMNHAWNLVCIDDQWYHVDVTWDDPTPDAYGFVRHEFFLRTDEEMSAGEKPHYNWESVISCTDTRFSNAFWNNVNAQICFTDSNTAYYVRSADWTNYICRRDIPTGEETKIYTDKKEYINIGEGSYSYSHGSLSLWNDRLYYNTQSAVKSMNTDGSDVQNVYRYDVQSNGRFLYACHVDKDMLYISADDHDHERIALTQELESSGYHIHSFTSTTHPATCTEPGYDVSVCECGLTFQSDHTAKAEHTYAETSFQKASIFSEGHLLQECTYCGDETMEYYPQINVITWLAEHPKTATIGLLVLAVLLSALGNRKKQKTKS